MRGFGGILGILIDRGSFVDIIICLISSAIVVFLTLPIHEYAHGFAATKLGDPTPRYQGRMTLNPLAHLDYFGSLMIFLIGFGWAKPVQIDARYFNKPKRDMAITAFAGPFSNLIIALISCLLANLMAFLNYVTQPQGFMISVISFIYYIFFYISAINISLAVFNLIPLPPLDGSKILAAFLPDRIYYQLMRYERYFMFIIFALIFFGSGISNFLSVITYKVYSAFDYITWLPFELILG